MLDIKNALSSSKIKWSGDYNSWEDALKNSGGYDTNEVFQKVLNASRKVRDGKAVFERDSVLFYEPEYNWPILSGLLLAALENDRKLNVLDFGGALGSTYFQHREMLEHYTDVKWNIVEQVQFVEYGKEEFQTDSLHFYPSLQECIDHNNINVAILSSVLPYIDNPYGIIRKIYSYGIQFLIIDRTPLIERQKDRLTIQEIPENIYSASYPAWFFSRENFLSFLDPRYHILSEFNSITQNFTIIKPEACAVDTGFILKLKKKR